MVDVDPREGPARRRDPRGAEDVGADLVPDEGVVPEGAGEGHLLEAVEPLVVQLREVVLVLVEVEPEGDLEDALSIGRPQGRVALVAHAHFPPRDPVQLNRDRDPHGLLGEIAPAASGAGPAHQVGQVVEAGHVVVGGHRDVDAVDDRVVEHEVVVRGGARAVGGRSPAVGADQAVVVVLAALPGGGVPRVVVVMVVVVGVVVGGTTSQ